MNAKLLITAAASLFASATFAGECPGRAGVCWNYTAVKTTPGNYNGTPVAQVNGRGANVIAKLPTSKAKEAVVSYERLYRAGRA